MPAQRFGRRTVDTPEYSMFPRVVPEGWEGNLSIFGDYEHTRLEPGTAYTYSVRSMRWNVSHPRKKDAITGVASPDERGVLTLPFAPDFLGEWQVEIAFEDLQRRSYHLPATMGVYVQPPEELELRPYLGELHSHSDRSDGMQTPVYCPIRAREFGFDFYTLTDHRNYDSSRRVLAGAPALIGDSMLLLPGEELHPEKDDIESGEFKHYVYHLTAIGHSESVRDLYLADPERSRREVSAIVAELTSGCAIDGLDLRVYAESVWKARKTRELGGIVLFAHPYWPWPSNLDESAREKSFLDREYDAVEVISPVDTSNVMPNRWAGDAIADNLYPAVGVADCHNWGPDVQLTACTYVLARELTAEAVLDSIRAGRSLAYENDGRGRLVGPWRLVDFAEFYLMRLWPLKHRIMKMQAALAFENLRTVSIPGVFECGWETTAPDRVDPALRTLVRRLDDELAELDRRLWVAG